VLAFHFLDSNHAIDVRPLNCTWPEFYDRAVDLPRYALSGMPANRHAESRWRAAEQENRNPSTRRQLAGQMSLDFGHLGRLIGNQTHAIAYAVALEHIDRFIRHRLRFAALDRAGIPAGVSLASYPVSDDS
jgi:hypothetical protein